jgi:hypothetical protein
VTKSTHNRQREYQHRVLIESGVGDPTLLDPMLPQWWRNPTNPNSLRLTVFGHKYFTTKLNRTSHKIKLAEPIKLKHLLQLERLFQEPYYLTNEFICVLGDQDAVMLQLHAGDLDQYLDNLQINSRIP